MLQRVVVVGASASAGYELAYPDGSTVSLARTLDRMIVGLHEPPLDLADGWFFASAWPKGRQQREDALSHEPTLVVGIDFLFWFLYGLIPEEEKRLDLLESGLKLLEGFECPVLVSQIPDMSPAVGKMLFEVQVPAPETLEAANRRIVEWSAEQGNVILVPMAEFAESLAAGKTLRVRQREWSPEEAEELLQDDRLHPTIAGVVVLAALAMDASLKAGLEFDEDDFDWDADQLAAALEEERRDAWRRMAAQEVESQR